MVFRGKRAVLPASHSPALFTLELVGSDQPPFGTPTILRKYFWKQVQQNCFCTTEAMLAGSPAKARRGRHVIAMSGNTGQ